MTERAYTDCPHGRVDRTHCDECLIERAAQNFETLKPGDTVTWTDETGKDTVFTAEGEPRDPLLVERESTHGDFAKNAEISQDFKRIFRTELEDVMEPEVITESLDMIALKLSRILSGKFDEPDHWRDIAGYANLVVEHLEKK